MRKHLAVLSVLAALSLAPHAAAQTRRAQPTPARRNAPAAAAGLIAQLPASDAVMTVDVKRLFNEAMPRAYASNPAELARVNGEIDKFKERTGLDARQFAQLAFGVRYTQTPSGATTMDAVAIGRGTFNSASIVSAGRLASKGKYQETKYGGKSVHVFGFDERVKLLGLFNAHLTELAVSALDANTLAVGKPARVREAIDAAAGRGRVSAEIASLAAHSPEAIIGLGGTLPASATRNLDFLSAEFSRSVASIRQFYGSVGSSAEGFQMQTVFRTETAGAAKTLGDTVEGLKQFAPFAIGQMAKGNAEKARLLRSVVGATRVSAQGNELQISLALAETDLAALIQAF
ncbi:MAG TPA: hypothetical protein VM864_02075 [Pyrinomonadaceae bacterium]|jgi:hypothetical protein|nr:hypothetical protein [Pyrinomonadaceae bacterium]